MKRLCTALALAMLAGCTPALAQDLNVRQFDRTVDPRNVTTTDKLTWYAGESIEYIIRSRLGREVVDVPPESTVVWRVRQDTNDYLVAAGEVVTNGTVRFRVYSPDANLAPGLYTSWAEAFQGTNLVGVLDRTSVEVKWRPGDDYAIVPPITNLFDQVLAAWNTAGVAAVAADLSAHAADTDNPHGVTAGQIGALTEEEDAAALAAVAGVSGRVDTVESWGDHAEAGYLTAEADAAALSAVAAVSGRVDTVEGWGDHAEAGYLTAEADAAALEALRDRDEAILENPYRFSGTWFKGQTHYHTTVSDGEASPVDMAAAYKAAGFDFVVTTDHNAVAPDPAVDGLLYIPGAEETAHTLPGPPSAIYPLHVVSIGATGDADYMAAPEVLDSIVAQGAMPVLAHPNFAGYQWTDLQIARSPGFVGVEVYSAKSELLHGGGEGYADDVVDRMLTAGSRAWLYAADDAHKLSEVGQGWVVVCADSLTTNGILAALRRGSFYGTQGPELSHSMTGSTVHVETDAPANIRFVGAGGATLAEAPASTAASYKAVGGERYVRVIVTRDSDGLMAWGQPYYVRTPIEQPGEQSFAAKEIYGSNLKVRGTVMSEDPASEFIFGTFRDIKWNAAAGFQALLGAVNPIYNFAGGMGAMRMSTNCNHNGAVGYNVMQAANDSDFNGALGYMTLDLSLNSHYNAAAGAQAMNLARNSSYNFAGGVMALSRATAVSNSAALGAWAGRRATGRDRVYVDSLAADPGATWSPTNNALFVDDGSVHIGRGGDHAAGRTNHFRGAWLWAGLPILDYAASAYGWGDHAEAGYLTAESDAAALSAVTAVSGRVDTVESWGDHGEAGYLTAESDAAALSAVAAVSGRVDTVEGWGDHAEAGYLTSFWTNNVDANDTEIDNLNTLGVALITGPGSKGRNISPYDGAFGGAWNFETDEPTVKGARILRHSTLTPCRFFEPDGDPTFDHGVTMPHTLAVTNDLVTYTNRYGHTRMVITTTNDYQRSSGYIEIFGGTNLLDSFNPGCDGSAYTSDYPWVEGGSTITLALHELPGAPGVTSAPPVITSLDVYNMADTSLVSRAMIDTQNQVIGGDYPSIGRQWANKDYADDVADAALAAANAETHYRTSPTDLQGQPVRWNPRFDTVTETNRISWKYGGETYWSVDGEGATVIPEIRSFTVAAGATATLTVWSYSGGATNLIPEVSTNLQSWTRLDTNAIVSAEMVDDFTAQVVFTNAAATAMFVRLVDVSGGEGRPVIYAHAPVLALHGLIVPGGATNTFSRAGTTNDIYVDAASNLVVAANGTAAITVSPAGDVGVGTTPSASFSLRTDASFYAGGQVRAGSYLMAGNGQVFLNSSGTSWLQLDGTNLTFRATNGITGRVQMNYD